MGCRAFGGEGAPGLGRSRLVCRSAGVVSAGGQCRGVPRAFGRTCRHDGPRTRRRRERAPNQRRTGPHARHAHRRAQRRVRRPVDDPQFLLQTGGSSLPRASAALDLRDVAGIPLAQRGAAPTQQGASEYPEPDRRRGAGALPGRECRAGTSPAEDDPDGRRRRQGRSHSRSHGHRRSPDRQHARRRGLSLAAPTRAVRGLRRRGRPGRLRGVRLRRCCAQHP